MARIKVKNKEHSCPKCKCEILIGVSRQCSEDCCEMWYQCEKCGYYPDYDRVETVWGWNDEYRVWAFELWVDGILAEKRLNNKRDINHVEDPPLEESL